MRALLLSALLAACSSPTSPPAGSPSTPPTSTASPTTVASDSIVVNDPARRLTVRIAYPVLSGDAAALDAVNEQLHLTAEQMWMEMAPEEPLGPDAGEWERYEFDGGFDVDLATDDYVSVLQALYAYTGGAHGNQFFAPQTYDLATGRPLDLDDAIQTTPAALAALRNAAERALITEMASRGETDEAEAREWIWLEDFTASRETFDGRWTIGTDSLYVHLAPYVVAPYAAGSFRLAIPYGDLAGHLGPVASRLAAREDDASGD